MVSLPELEGEWRKINSERVLTEDSRDYDLFTGTSVEDFARKVDESDQMIEDWDGDELWFTTRVHNHPRSAVYYAGQAVSGGARRDYGEELTPAIIKWKVPEEWVSTEKIGQFPDNHYIVDNDQNAEFWGYRIPSEGIDAIMVAGEGSRMKEGWKIDPEGWKSYSYVSE